MTRKHQHRQSAIFFAALVATFLSSPLAAETEFEKWQAQQQQQFANYLSKEDQAFSDFLRREWEDFEVFKGHVQDPTPKPAEPPTIRNKVQSSSTQPNLPANAFFKKVYRKPFITTPGAIPGFYGHGIPQVTLPVNAKRLPRFTPPSNELIADAWKTLASTPHDAELTELQQLKSQLQLGDWGLLKLVQHLTAAQIKGKSQQTVYAWFLMNKLGYNIKIGYSHSELMLLMPSSTKVFGNLYTEIDDTFFYMLPQPTSEKVFTYRDDNKPSGKPMDLSFQHLISATGEINQVQIWVEQLKQPLSVSFDQGVSYYLKDYPQIELAWYFRMEPGDPTKSSLISTLQPLIAQLSQRDAIDYLLKLTQRAFDYQTDQDQFKREKYLTIEESLTYGINDCEDRSIFLAWLLKSLLNVDVIALDYPGHIALAVKTRPMPTDALIVYQGNKYVVTDPTYIGADLGMAMPSLRKFTPNVIPVDYTHGANSLAVQ